VLDDLSVRLRQVKASDFEEEIDEESARLRGVFDMGTPLFVTPHAILNLAGRAVDSNEIRMEGWKSIAILALFRVGSVKRTLFRVDFEGFNDLGAMGVEFGHDQFTGPEKYVVKIDDAERLRTFWTAVSPVVPEHFYWAPSGTTYTPQGIAFVRYSDALENGPSEKRIANAVMGLESLLLGGAGEHSELSYRLGMRAAKLLGFCGCNPTRIRDVLRDAYGVRSTFVHGDNLGDRQKRKLQTKYGSEADLVREVLDYLRRAIVLSLLMNVAKKDLIAQLDSALVDPSMDRSLEREVRKYGGML